jgi:hypothetical protein
MKNLNQVSLGEIFIFSSNGLKYATEGIDGNKYRTCNKKYFQCYNEFAGQFMEGTIVNGRFVESDYIIQSFASGRGFNKHLLNESVTIINL